MIFQTFLKENYVVLVFVLMLAIIGIFALIQSNSVYKMNETFAMNNKNIRKCRKDMIKCVNKKMRQKKLYKLYPNEMSTRDIARRWNNRWNDLNPERKTVVCRDVDNQRRCLQAWQEIEDSDFYNYLR